MLTIGITGPSGSGKGEASSIFKKYGFEIIDGDTIAREVTAKESLCLWELTRSFGDILDDEGNLDRKVLSEIVFSNDESLSLLNEITHKYIIENINQKLDDYIENKKEMVCIDAAALIESGYNENCDFVIAVIAPFEIRLERILKRDNISEEMALSRLHAQPNDDFYINNSNYIIDNIDNNTTVLEKQIINFFEVNEISYKK